jgi:hypothetical protein
MMIRGPSADSDVNTGRHGIRVSLGPNRSDRDRRDGHASSESRLTRSLSLAAAPARAPGGPVLVVPSRESRSGTRTWWPGPCLTQAGTDNTGNLPVKGHRARASVSDSDAAETCRLDDFLNLAMP